MFFSTIQQFFNLQSHKSNFAEDIVIQYPMFKSSRSRSFLEFKDTKNINRIRRSIALIIKWSLVTWTFISHSL